MNSFLFKILFACFLNLNFVKSMVLENGYMRYYEQSKLFVKDEWLHLIVPNDSVQFFVLGDWGGLPVYPFRTYVEESIALEMAELAKFYNTKFQLALGDNFYFDGVNSTDDKRFKETFEDVFNEKALETPWFVLMGNHDHYGNASAQIEYSLKSKKWIMPDYNYTLNIKINNGNDDLIDILMIDTVLLCGNSGYDFEFSQPKYSSILEKKFSLLYLQSIEEELEKISKTLVPYILVAGHFPVWSISAHGPTKCLVDKLRPLLHKYNVSAYLCGHDHNLQHLTDTYLDTTVEYIVSGAANFNDNSTEHMKDVPDNSLKFFWGLGESEFLHGGLVVISANINNMTITYFETNGKELFQKIIYPRKFSKNSY